MYRMAFRYSDGYRREKQSASGFGEGEKEGKNCIESFCQRSLGALIPRILQQVL